MQINISSKPLFKFYKNDSPFSNFFLSSFSFQGRTFNCVEVPFQAMKFARTDPSYCLDILSVTSPPQSKKLGTSRSHPLDPEWDKLVYYDQTLGEELRTKDLVMYELLVAKFSIEGMRQVLLRPGDVYFFEDSPSDFYWGGQNGGKNMLGKLLTRLSLQFRLASSQTIQTGLALLTISNSSSQSLSASSNQTSLTGQNLLVQNQPPSQQYTERDLNSMPVTRLKEIIKQLQIKTDSTRKADFIKDILICQQPVEAPPPFPTQVFQGQLPTRDLDNRDQILNDLDQYGYCVVRAVSGAEADQLYSMVWDSFEALGTGINRSDPNTWKNQSNWPYNLHGIIKNFAVGWWPVCWEARLKCKRIFEMLWQTSDLITSFDGLCMMRPPEIDQALYRGTGAWNHRDQSLLEDRLISVQGFINLLDCGDHDGGLMIWPELHKCTHQFHAEMPRHLANWVMFEEKQMSRFRHLKVNLKKGEFVLWDSRLPHQNVIPVRGRNPEGRNILDLFRCVVYVCMLPRSSLTQEGHETRMKAIQEQLTTGHYAADPKTNPLNPQYGGPGVGSKANALTYHQLTDQMKSLL